MSISREFTGKTTEEAIDKGLREMQVSLSDVRIETLQEGSKGLFGLFGSRPAKVRITLNEEAPDARDLVHDIMFSSSQKSPKQEPARDRKPAPPAEKPAAEDKKLTDQPRPAPERKPEAKKKPAPEAAKPEPAKGEGGEKRPEGRRKPQGEGRKKSEPKPQEPKAPKAPKAPVEQLDPATKAGCAQSFLQELTRLMGVDVSVEVNTDDEGNIRVNMMGDTLGILIGRRGETLDALQYLTSLKVNKGQNEYTRVTLDTEHYRAKREEALVRLANRMANRVQKTGRKVSMEPMNPYERRILHSALQGNDFVTTHSEGEEPNRHVVITPKKAEKGEKADRPARQPRGKGPRAQASAPVSETPEEAESVLGAAGEAAEEVPKAPEAAAEAVGTAEAAVENDIVE